MRNCPKLSIAQQAIHSRIDSKRDADTSKQILPRASVSSIPNEPNPDFKRDGTAILPDQEQSPVRVFDPAMPAMSEESTPGTPLIKLFFVIGAVQTLPVWILADSDSIRNLIDKAVYKRLPFQPPIQDPGDVRVIGGNGEALDLKNFAVLPISLEENPLYATNSVSCTTSHLKS